MRTYTLEQIKAAYWAEFHECAERWYEYRGTPDENEAFTESEWQDFVEELDRAENIGGEK